MVLPPTELHGPRTVREAPLLLGDDPAGPRPLGGGTDLLPVAELCGEDGRALRPPPVSLVTGVSLPASSTGYRTGCAKYRLRDSVDFPLAGVAAGLRVMDGAVREVRIVLGTMAPHLVPAEEASAALKGREPSAAAFAEAASLAVGLGHPVGNLQVPAQQRRHVLEVLIRRLLTGLAAGDGA